MRIIAVVCILIGILIPTLVIYVDQQVVVHQDIRVEILSIEEAALPTPTPVPSITLLQNKSQVESFMLADTTSQNPYTDTYKCGNFANDVVVNATAKGIQAKVIIVLWVGSYVPHAIVLFPTAEGDIYVDATSGDWWVDFGLGDYEYNSYSMTDSTQFGFKDKTVEMYGIKENGFTNWVYVRPNPTPTPTPSPLPTPTPEPTIIPTPTPNPDGSPYFCKPCTEFITWNLNTWAVMWTCKNTSLLQNKEQVEAFLIYDKTDIMLFDDYICHRSAMSLLNNATANSIECYYVEIFFTTGARHAIVYFPTYEGPVYVDSTMNDWLVDFSLEEGGYNAYSIYDPNYNGYPNQTVDQYLIYRPYGGVVDWWRRPLTD